ncbi:MAG: serine/threonine-protein kinase [Terracidiphilus sp.]|nr:serine/threonine-protein kinase [Terracidiphilus sp.]
MEPDRQKPLEPGDVLDHYRLEAVVARGGMSTLYRAVDTRDGRQVALKVPHPEMETDPVLMERFKREQQIGQELDHPGIVKTYNGEERSRMYMVIEWVDGRLLRSILNAGKLPVERASSLTVAICDALDYMHKRGVVHRDLKPENIMVSEGDRIKLIDFGIAMKEDARRLTYAGSSPLLGTPDYIAPEQVKGQRGDQRSDIYALGAMFYEMLTGQPPYSGPNPLAVMNERLLHDPEPARKLSKEITPQLEEVLFRALEREPRHRYATALEMAWDIEHQEQVGVEENVRKPAFHQRLPKGPRLALYVGMVLGPMLLFVLMLVLAKR